MHGSVEVPTWGLYSLKAVIAEMCTSHQYRMVKVHVHSRSETFFKFKFNEIVLSLIRIMHSVKIAAVSFTVLTLQSTHQ